MKQVKVAMVALLNEFEPLHLRGMLELLTRLLSLESLLLLLGWNTNLLLLHLLLPLLLLLLVKPLLLLYRLLHGLLLLLQYSIFLRLLFVRSRIQSL
jgi:hypothetical protein